MQEVSPPQDLLSPDEIGRQLEAVEREAYQRGFESGEQAGRELGFKEIQTANQVLLSLIEEIKDLKEELLKGSETDILNAVMAVSRQVLGDELSLNPGRIIELIQEAIRKIGQSDTYLIRLNPDDHRRISKEKSKVIEGLDNIKWLRLDPDSTLLEGECIIESTNRMVDARLESRLGIIEDALYKAMEET